MKKESDDLKFILEAIKEAKKSLNQGGEPIGSVLVKDNKIIGRGHNKRIQKSNPILHAEMDAIQNAGRLKASDYKKCTLYSTLSPCDMCSGTILLYKIPRIVIGENQTFKGPESYLKKRKVKIKNLNLQECKTLMNNFIKNNPKVWNEDIGE